MIKLNFNSRNTYHRSRATVQFPFQTVIYAGHIQSQHLNKSQYSCFTFSHPVFLFQYSSPHFHIQFPHFHISIFILYIFSISLPEIHIHLPHFYISFSHFNILNFNFAFNFKTQSLYVTFSFLYISRLNPNIFVVLFSALSIHIHISTFSLHISTFSFHIFSNLMSL